MLVQDGPKSEAAFWLIAICKMSTPICMISINQNPKRVKLASLFIFRSVQKSYNQIKWFHFLSHAIYYYPIIIQQSDGKQLVSTSFNCWQTDEMRLSTQHTEHTVACIHTRPLTGHRHIGRLHIWWIFMSKWQHTLLMLALLLLAWTYHLDTARRSRLSVCVATFRRYVQLRLHEHNNYNRQTFSTKLIKLA